MHEKSLLQKTEAKHQYLETEAEMMLKATEGVLISAKVPSSPLNRSQLCSYSTGVMYFCLFYKEVWLRVPPKFPGMGL